MAVTEGTIDVSGTNDKLDTTIVTQDDGTQAHREGVFIGDPEVNGARAIISGDGLSVDDYGSRELLVYLLKEITTLNARFEEAFQTGITDKDINYEN